MKKETTLTQLLGITQLDAAMLLGVSTSQWSMYSSGKRDLPVPAMALLAEMLAYVKSAEANPKSKKATEEQGETQQYLERRLHENEYRQQQLVRKMETAQRKQLAQSRKLLLSEFLEQRNAGKQVITGHEVFKMKVTQTAQTTVSDLLAAQQHQKELFELERKMLESKLTTLRRGGENSSI
jgi:transcriptional regulator with XRE-family HTH domain